MFDNDYLRATRLSLRRRGEADASETLIIERGPGGEFRLRQPADLRIDQRAVAVIMQSVLGLKVQQFMTGSGRADEVSMGPAPEPMVAVEISGTAGTERLEVFEINAGSMVCRAMPRNIVFRAATDMAREIFAVQIGDLRSKVLLPVAVADIGKIVIDPGAGRGVPLELTRDGAMEFKLRQPVRMKAHTTQVNKLLQAFRNLQVIAFVADDAGDLGRFGLGQDALRVSVRGVVHARPWAEA